MMRFAAIVLSAVLATAGRAGVWRPSDWPVLRTYDGEHLHRIALPLGGIGTGTISLGGRGEIRDHYQIMNEPASGDVDKGDRASKGPIFLVHVASADGSASTTRMLAGPLYAHEKFQQNGCPVPYHGVPRFAQASFSAAYPFGTVTLSDPSLPIRAKVRGFNPLVPGDADASSLPVAVLTCEVANTSSVPLSVSVCGAMCNFIGRDAHASFKRGVFGEIPPGAKRNRNDFRESGTANVRGIFFRSEGVAADSPAWGTIALGTEERDVTWRLATRNFGWHQYTTLLQLWDDFNADGRLSSDPPDDAMQDPLGALAVGKPIAPGACESFTFFLTWSFPNRKAWSERIEGNHYCRAFPDAWTAMEKIVPQMPALERRTRAFVTAVLESSFADSVKEAALFNLSVLRSQTVFRLPDGHLMGWEGVMARDGSCYGSCTHVWNFEQALPFLFGDLARSMRDVEFAYATRDDGHMAFRANLPLSEAGGGGANLNGKRITTAADGQMGCIVKAWREWRFSGDRAFLARLWPRIRAALAYAWIPDGWDADRDGAMEGRQDNTWDIPYFGPNPEVGFWYLGALKAGADMAEAMGDTAFAAECRRIYAEGSRFMDARLFNGACYEQIVYDPQTRRPLAPGASPPRFQMGTACLSTQLAGQFAADVCGLGALADRVHERKAMETVWRRNFREDFTGWFTNARSFVFPGEAGLLNATWRDGERPTVPMPCFAEAWTGFEYTAAGMMAMLGMTNEAVRLVSAVRARFDGATRNPFDEPECGSHYARSLASWGLVPAFSGFRWDGVARSMSFAAGPGRWFWSNGSAWGTCEIDSSACCLTVAEGKLELATLSLGGGPNLLENPIRLGVDESVRLALNK